MGSVLYLRFLLTGEFTAAEAKKEVDDLIDIRKHHHNGEDLPKLP